MFESSLFNIVNEIVHIFSVLEISGLISLQSQDIVVTSFYKEWLHTDA